MQRIKNVLNVHFVDRKGTFLVPIYILAAMVAIVIAIGIIARVAGANEADLYEGMKWNGAVWALLGMGFGIGAMTMTQYLSFALGLGITRREWLAGSSVMFVLIAAGTAVTVMVLKLIEQATTGFGLSVRLFDTVHTGPASWWQTLLQVFLMVMAAHDAHRNDLRHLEPVGKDRSHVARRDRDRTRRRGVRHRNPASCRSGDGGVLVVRQPRMDLVDGPPGGSDADRRGGVLAAGQQG